jgi:hypothetical protein
MARGIKANPNRKEVRNTIIPIRLNEYELEGIMTCLDILKDDRPISVFIRDTINAKCKEMNNDIDNT